MLIKDDILGAEPSGATEPAISSSGNNNTNNHNINNNNSNNRNGPKEIESPRADCNNCAPSRPLDSLQAQGLVLGGHIARDQIAAAAAATTTNPSSYHEENAQGSRAVASNRVTTGTDTTTTQPPSSHPSDIMSSVVNTATNNTKSSSTNTTTTNNNHNKNHNSNNKTTTSNDIVANKLANELGVDNRELDFTHSDNDLSVDIIHFNDCYNIEPGAKSSGAAGFLTAVNQHRHSNPMILFSGDIISPSFMSTFTKGEQMIPVLNDLGVHCAVFGNHEFDYGVDNLIDFTKRTSFPWLLSNVIDKETSGQLGDGEVFHILERQGLKFGLIGLIEEEWLSTLSTLDSSDVIYTDFVDRGRELARMLKSEPHNVDYVIALTHFRTPNDIRLADSVPEIDLILGGHDHDYEVIKRPHSYVIKSGTDFREFSKITLKINPEYIKSKQTHVSRGHKSPCKPICDTKIERIECIGYKPDVELERKLQKFVTSIDEKMGKVLGQFNCELDGRFSSIRNYETNLGNFVTDIMLASTHADLAILNSGTLRSDRIHPKGDFTMRDLFNILGYIDPIAVLQATGKNIWKALENGVSQWPKLEGRFPQVSGCSFTFDPKKPPMQRIDPKDVTVGDEPLDLGRQYRLTTKAYLASGKDGYDMLKECEILVPGDESPDLTTSILNHFEAISIVKSNRRTHHRQSIICLSRSSLKKILDQTPASANNGDSAAYSPTSNATFDTLTGHGHETPKSTSITNGHGDHETLNDANNNSQRDVDADKEECGDQLVELNRSPSANGRNLWRSRSRSPNSSTPIVGQTAPTPTLQTILPQSHHTAPPSTIRQPRTKRLMSLYEMEHEQCKLEPKIEGRIRILGVNA